MQLNLYAPYFLHIVIGSVYSVPLLIGTTLQLAQMNLPLPQKTYLFPQLYN